jgi:hypothetical protein
MVSRAYQITHIVDRGAGDAFAGALTYGMQQLLGEHPFSLWLWAQLAHIYWRDSPLFRPCRAVKCPVFIAFSGAHPSCNTFVIGDPKKRCYNRR